VSNSDSDTSSAVCSATGKWIVGDGPPAGLGKGAAVRLRSGMIASTPLALATSISPHPKRVSGPAGPRSVAVERRASATSPGVHSGCSCSRSAQAPLTMDAENEVPLRRRYSCRLKGSAGDPAPRPLTVTICWPGATTSGLIRPSAVGPLELKEARTEFTGCTAPTATTPAPSPGTVM
jgi:hypothetical protein